MKFRNDFITNSSSSSFIVSLKEEIPIEFKKYEKLLTPINSTKDFLNKVVQWTDEDLLADIKKEGHFSDEQIEFIIAYDEEVYEEFKLVRNSLLKLNEKLYYFSEDWDYMYYHNDFIDFLKKNMIINLD